VTMRWWGSQFRGWAVEVVVDGDDSSYRGWGDGEMEAPPRAVSRRGARRRSRQPKSNSEVTVGPDDWSRLRAWRKK
jgi:hypothetical protein